MAIRRNCSGDCTGSKILVEECDRDNRQATFDRLEARARVQAKAIADAKCKKRGGPNCKCVGTFRVNRTDGELRFSGGPTIFVCAVNVTFTGKCK